MNINKTLVTKLHFLTENGYVLSIHKNKLYCKIQFKKAETTISFSYDCHQEFLDMVILSNSNVRMETSYHRLLVNGLTWDTDEFTQQLAIIYSLSRPRYSLSPEQYSKLINLYASFIAKKIGDGSLS